MAAVQAAGPEVKVPKTIQIASHVFTIVLSRKIADHEGLDGDVHFLDQKIRVWSLLPPTRRLECLIHEVLHAAGKVFTRKESVSETILDGIGEALAQVLTHLGLELDWSDIPEEE